MKPIRRIDPEEGIIKSFVDIPDITAGALNRAALEATDKKAAERLSADMQRLEIWGKNKKRVTAFNERHTLKSDMIPIEFFTTYPKAKETDLLSTNALGLTGSQEVEFMMYSLVKNLADGKIYTVSDYLTDYIPNPAYEDYQNKIKDNPRLKDFLPEPPAHVYTCENIWYNTRFQINPLKLDVSPEAYYSFYVPSSTLLTEYKIK